MANSKREKKYYCPTCGGTNVYWDAWVGANDEDDVLGPYDAAYCADCEEEQSHLEHGTKYADQPVT